MRSGGRRLAEIASCLALSACVPQEEVLFDRDVRWVASVELDQGRAVSASRLQEKAFSLTIGEGEQYVVLGWRPDTLAGAAEPGMDLEPQHGCAPALPLPDGAFAVATSAEPISDPSSIPRVTTKARVERCRCFDWLQDVGLTIDAIEIANSLNKDVSIAPASSTSVFLYANGDELDVLEVEVEATRRLPAATYLRTSDGTLWAEKREGIFKGTTTDDLQPIGVTHSGINVGFAGSPPWSEPESSALYYFHAKVVSPLWGRTYPEFECEFEALTKQPFWTSPDDFLIRSGSWFRVLEGRPERLQVRPSLYPLVRHPGLGVIGAGEQGALFVTDIDNSAESELLPARGPIDRVEGLAIYGDEIVVARTTGEISFVSSDGTERLLTTLPRIPKGVVELEDGFAVIAKDEPPGAHVVTDAVVYFFGPSRCL